MNLREKISSNQVMVLTILFTVGSSILELPSGMVHIAKQDAWIAMILGILMDAVVLAIYMLLTRLYPDKSLNEINDIVLGKWIGKVVSFLFHTTTFILAPTAVLYFVGQFVTVQIMVETPKEAIHLLFGFIMILAVRYGIEVFARASEIIILIFLLLFLGGFPLLIPQIEPANLLPVLEADASDLFWAALYNTAFSAFPLIVVVHSFAGRVNDRTKMVGAFLLGNFIGGLILLIVIMLSVVVLGPLTELFMFPSYALVQRIDIGNFIQRIEAILAVMWLISLFIKLVMYYHSAVVGIGELFRVSDYRLLAFPLGVILIYLSLNIFPNDPYQVKWNEWVWLPHSIIIGLIYPISLLILGYIRSKISKKKLSS
jgi:spore germination protein KB